MDVITHNWKSTIFCQLKEHNREQNGYDHIVEHCIDFFVVFPFDYWVCLSVIDNRILENNAILQIQCGKLEKDVNHLRLSNAGLERASEAR
jgi:hypothetical protein